MTTLKNVVLVGASGSVGQAVLNGLLAPETIFNVTLLVRAGSSSKIAQEGHAAVTVVRGDLGDDAFLQSTLTGQDALVITLSATPDSFALQNRLVDAAAAVGVKRIIPNEFGSDLTNPKIVEAVPLFQGKLNATKYIEDVVFKNPTTTWTAVVTGPFYEWCLERGLLGFDIKNRTVTLCDEGATKFDTTNIVSLGKIVSGILKNPDIFKNRYAFVSELTVSQNDILEALLKATKTNLEDWKVDNRTTTDLQKEGIEKVGKGDFSGALLLIGAALFKTGLGADYSTAHRLDNALLGLEKCDLDKVTTNVVQRQ